MLHVLNGESDSADGIEPRILFCGRNGSRIVINRFDRASAEARRGQAENPAAGAEISESDAIPEVNASVSLL